MKHNLKNIGRRIRQSRLDAKLPQKSLAKLARVCQPNLSNYERGMVEPSLPTIIRLAHVLGVPAMYLIGKDV